MKVLLKEDVDNLGYAGEVHKVADGYGRNYLIPKGMAVLANPSVMKQAEIWRKKAEARRAELRAEHEALSVKIEETTLTFTARAGETGKLYGSVTTAQIADALNSELGTEIDRRKVGVEPLRQLGEHQVVVRLSGDFQPHVTVRIESEDGLLAPAFEEEVTDADVEVDAEVNEESIEMESDEVAVDEIDVQADETE
ncbi:MAG: 50S ribosomal protein L9 [Candidatus Promineifilaceae bacterium]|nr:50S ribosomal protein L9 [Candidatus Promineifilaceae bacterium]